MIDIFYMKLKGNDQYLNYFLNFLPDEKVQKIKKMKNICTKRQHIFSFLLNKYVLLNTYNIVFCNNDLSVNQYGKPYLKDNRKYFNISHSGEYLIIAYDDFPIGIDIEEIKFIKHENFKNIFTEYEYSQIICNEKEILSQFYLYWTLKESYLKFLGVGLYREINSFQFSIKDKNIYLKDNENLENESKLKFNYFHFDNLMISICSAFDSRISDFKIIDMDLVVEYFKEKNNEKCASSALEIWQMGNQPSKT